LALLRRARLDRLGQGEPGGLERLARLANPTVSPASENTRGTTASSAFFTSASSPSRRASVTYWWSWTPRRRFASWTVPIGPSMPAVLVGVQDLLSRVEQHAVAVDEALVVDGLVGLPRLSNVIGFAHTFCLRSPCFCRLCCQWSPCQKK
jgi:hypothetical protein